MIKDAKMIQRRVWVVVILECAEPRERIGCDVFLSRLVGKFVVVFF
jgi:hypothetical protein